MAKKNSLSETQIKKRIKEGRGSGHDSSYLPWVKVNEVPSLGRSHRIFGHKSQRTHHLLSDLELSVFLLFEWHKDTIEIREQFPLRQEDTLALAKDAGIRHPAIAGVNQIMSSDFLINTRDLAQPKFVLQAKYASALDDRRTIEKLELERRYWQDKEVPWMLITEQDISKVVFNNINWLYSAQRDELEDQELLELTEYYHYHFSQHPHLSIINIAQKLDTAYKKSMGQSLLEIRRLLANRCLIFDIFRPFNKIKANELIIEDIPLLLEARYES